MQTKFTAAGSQEGQPCSGEHQAQHGHVGKGGDCLTLLCSGVASPPVLGLVWALPYKKVIKLLETVRKKATRMVKSLEGKVCEELRTLHLFSLEMRRSGDLITVCNFLMSGRGGAGTDLFSVVNSDSTRGNGLKLSQGSFRLLSGKGDQWNGLPREVVTALSLTEFKKYLDNTLGHMV
ncbi:hypothetical protein DUI87_08320 [Hirundo rustica rustica]|uniref:Uncharacterized protein n=1 Tax=Hirundo rustica rustica TaxID=333673 RepID=A0A3M0KTW2_HIRRU|nr:hypothetical protein DUI87_08320 [Hirundo rustica rustica]